MKYEEATKYLYEIIVNYDNKNKKAYLLLLQILYDINEYNRAKLLIAKIYKMFTNENDLNEFKEIDKDVDSCIKRINNNIQRQFYYNAEKEIAKFRKSLEKLKFIIVNYNILLVISKILIFSIIFIFSSPINEFNSNCFFSNNLFKSFINLLIIFLKSSS